MNTATLNWVSIGPLSDIPRQGARRVKAGHATIAIFRTVDDRVFALEDKCPHKAGPLSQGIVHGDCVTCPLHNWVISLESGEAQGADEGKVARYATLIASGEVFLSFQSPSLATEG
tara:strand:- start:5286 stop:5633 length:348 start_codon:yes stop_codon:yes gene_type:complete